VTLDAALPAISARARPLARGLTARVGLTLVVACSFLVRIVASTTHPVARYFPDEYFYTALARSLGQLGRPLVRGESAHFPALLEPLLAAPFQALFSPQVAYQLTQAENALAMSLAAIPVYLLARRLTLSAPYALACAVFAIAIPDLVYSSYTLADPVAYPLALAALYVGVVAIDKPTRRAQLGFLALALLATFARLQYIVLPVAFFASAILIDRRRVLRTQRLPLVLCALAILGGVALGPSRALGFYSGTTHLHLGSGLLHWSVIQVLLLSLVAGVVLVPGALVALARPRGRTETAFAACTAVFAAGLLAEAALVASDISHTFPERYLFALLPLVPIAFGLYLKHGRPARIPVALIAAGLFLVSVRVPISGYSAAGGETDSPFLFAVNRLESIVGTSNGSLVVALLVALGAAGAVAVSRRGGARIAVGATIVFAAVTSLGAIVNESAISQSVRNADFPASGTSWIDALGLQNVTLVETVGAPRGHAMEQLYWNRSVTHEALLGAALPTDRYSPPPVRVARDGTLVGIGRNLVVEDFGTIVRFANAKRLARAGGFSVWSADGPPRLTMLDQGRYSDGWLANSGRLTIWPDASGRTRGALRFSLSLPRTAPPVTVHFGKERYRVKPGHVIHVRYPIDVHGPATIEISSPRWLWLLDMRAVSVLSTPPVFARAHRSTDAVTASA
jgi:Dolichyl-phosphate-mannose-protein mannosyltransferase